MSGSNGVQRWAKVNREDELVPLKSRGATMYAYQFQSISTTTIVPGSNPPVSTNPNPTVLTPPQMFQNLTFDAGTINTITAPAFSLVATELSKQGLLEVGYSWTVYYRNTIPQSAGSYGPIATSGAKVINFPADWSISGLVGNTLTIGPGETVAVTYVIESLGPPVRVRLMTGPPQSSGGRNPYYFDKGVTIRPSNNDPLVNDLSIVRDFSIADSQHMISGISHAIPYSVPPAGFSNAMFYLRSDDPAPNAQDLFILCSPGSLPVNAGNFYVTMGGAVFAISYNLISSSIYKTDIVPITSDLDEAYQMLPYQYRYNWDPVGTKRFGFIADQVDNFPTLVPATPDNESVDLYAVLAIHQQMIRDLNQRVIDLIAQLKAAPNNLVLP